MATQYKIAGPQFIKKYKPSQYTRSGKDYILNQGVNPISGTAVAFNIPDVVSPQEKPVLSYEDWLRGAGLPYANLYSNDVVSQQYDPYFNSLLGAEDYQRGLAQEDLTKSIQNTQNNYDTNFNNAGIFGSGIYQNELQKQLNSLNQNFNRNYGVGQYTPYSQRKQEIEQNKLLAKEQAKLNRQQNAFNVYSQQFYPEVASQ